MKIINGSSFLKWPTQFPFGSCKLVLAGTVLLHASMASASPLSLFERNKIPPNFQDQLRPLMPKDEVKGRQYAQTLNLDPNQNLGGQQVQGFVQGQVTDPSQLQFRIDQLEEQVRVMNGQVENLTFQLQQMQELVQRMQSDYEFRFEELESKADQTNFSPDMNKLPSDNSLQSGDGINEASSGKQFDKTEGMTNTEALDTTHQKSNLANNQVLDSTLQPDVSQGELVVNASDVAAADLPVSDLPSLDLSTLNPGLLAVTLSNGSTSIGGLATEQGQNSVAATDGNANKPVRLIDLDQPVLNGLDRSSFLTATNPDELYTQSYEALMEGQYHKAKSGFEAFVARYPQHAKNEHAQFWLGESLLAQGNYKRAIEVFSESYRLNPDSERTPETLLKLGTALHNLGDTPDACRTWQQAITAYPESSEALKRRLNEGMEKAACI